MAPSSLLAAAAAAALLLGAPSPVDAHIEDICFGGGGIRNFYQYSSALGCRYAPKGLRGTFCSLAVGLEVLMSDQLEYNSTCRGVVHFDSVYFIAAALGFRQEIAYFFAAYSQLPDHAEFVMMDSCGRPLDEAYWPPPMRGLVRTELSSGGSNMHFGLPFAGEQLAGRCEPKPDGGPQLECPELQQQDKSSEHWPAKQSASRATGCVIDAGTREDFETVAASCPGLNYTLDQSSFYDGPLRHWKRWAFNETNLLCNGGYTTLGPDGNPTTGSACPKGGIQYWGTDSAKVFGFVAMDGFMRLGEQIIDFDCVPSCACWLNCTDSKKNTDFEMINVRTVHPTPTGSSFGDYLKEMCEGHGRGCLPQGGTAPELVARTGILLHYVVDRGSHWYCTDAPHSGVMLQRTEGKAHEYDLVLYMQTDVCSLTEHMNTHYWEQGMGDTDPYLSPATLAALNQMYDMLSEFATTFRETRPEWFNSSILPMSREKMIGSQASPGILYNMVRHLEAEKRVKAHMQALRENDLPPVPGWEKVCGMRETDGLPVKRFATQLADKLIARPHDCGLRSLLHVVAEDGWRDGQRAAALWAAEAFDVNGDGVLSEQEVAAWERHPAVMAFFEQCDFEILVI